MLEKPPVKIDHLLRRFPAKCRELGVLGTLQLIPLNLRTLALEYLDKRHDRQHGINTAGWLELQELAIDSPNKSFGIRYQPSSRKRLEAIFANLPADLSDFTFVDFGSGRGRVLVFASKFGFKKIVGVEFSEELHRSAVDNVASSNSTGRRCTDIQALHLDATQFDIPAGPLVLYFFDPFREQVMQQVLDKIRDAYSTAPRKIYLMYLAPVHEAMVEATGLFRRVQTPKLPHELSLKNQYKLAFFET
jgi:SAM-dependent methyltransferase